MNKYVNQKKIINKGYQMHAKGIQIITSHAQ